MEQPLGEFVDGGGDVVVDLRRFLEAAPDTPGEQQQAEDGGQELYGELTVDGYGHFILTAADQFDRVFT